LSESERIQARFLNFNVVRRDRHDDFADQTDGIRIGAARCRSRNATVAGRRSGSQDVAR
jgi:hypothetical protein